MPGRKMSPEELREFADDFRRRSRAAQGLPEHVEDPETLERIARIMRATPVKPEAQAS